MTNSIKIHFTVQSPWLYIYLFSLQKNKNKKRYFYNKIWLISFFYNRIPVFGYVKEFHVLLLVLLGMFFCGGTLTFGLIYSVFKMAVNSVADFFKKFYLSGQATLAIWLTCRNRMRCLYPTDLVAVPEMTVPACLTVEHVHISIRNYIWVICECHEGWEKRVLTVFDSLYM